MDICSLLIQRHIRLLLKALKTGMLELTDLIRVVTEFAEASANAGAASQPIAWIDQRGELTQYEP